MNSGSECRHCGLEWDCDYEYCPGCDRNYSGAVYPSALTAEEFEAAMRVADEIRNAFRSVVLGDGMSLSQADLEGVYSEQREFDEARYWDAETFWWDISPDKLRTKMMAIFFLDPVGWRFYIPAFIVWTFNDWIKKSACEFSLVVASLASPYESNSAIEGRIQILDRPQRLAVLSYLSYFAKYCPYDRDEATMAFRYWESRVGSD